MTAEMMDCPIAKWDGRSQIMTLPWIQKTHALSQFAVRVASTVTAWNQICVPVKSDGTNSSENYLKLFHATNSFQGRTQM